MKRPSILLGVAVAIVAVALGTADATAGRPHPPVAVVSTGSVTTVRQATVVCPDVRGGPGGQVTWVRAAGTADIAADATPAITSTAVTAKPADFAPADTELGMGPYGSAFGGRVDSGTRALAFTATTPSAVGLGAIQVTRATTGIDRGIAAAGCVQPGTAFTFVGGSTIVGNELRLVLTNIDDTPASVDVNLIGPDGAVNAPGSTGLTVKPHSRLALDLGKLGPNKAELTTLVRAVTGRVAAAEVTNRRNGDTARGLAWIPDAGPASRRSLVPGMLAEASKRILVLADPGSVAANVTVQVVSDSGTFTPTGLDSLAVKPGSVLSLDVTSKLADLKGALLVTSDQPVLAGASQEFSAVNSQVTDLTWSGQTPNLTGTAVLPVVPIDSKANRDVVLYLSAVHGDATVTVTPNGALASGETELAQPVRLDVPAGETVTADLGRLFGVVAGDASVRVSADPARGPVTVSAVFREATATGLMVGQVGLVSVPGVIVLPPVREDPTVVGAPPGMVQPSEAP